MEWLKDKKNLPIVVTLAAVIFIAAGGLIALEAGLFSGQPSMPKNMASMGVPPPGMVGASGSGTTVPAAAGTGGSSGAVPLARVSTGAAAPAAPVLSNPATGPDPFSIPGGQKQLAKRLMASATAAPALRDILPPFNLFRIHAPALPISDFPPNTNNFIPPPNIHLIGIVNGTDGVSAILDVSGQSQTVKPGDSLQDGSKVTAIQPTSVTFLSSSGSTFSIPLTGGSDQTDQNQNSNGFNPQGNGNGFNNPGFNPGFNGENPNG